MSMEWLPLASGTKGYKDKCAIATSAKGLFSVLLAKCID